LKRTALSRRAPRSESAGRHGIVRTKAPSRTTAESITTKSPKPGAAARRLRRALREDAPPVPHLVGALREAHDRAVHLDRLEEDALVEQVAHVVR
jgi:hypothetical protein